MKANHGGGGGGVGGPSSSSSGGGGDYAEHKLKKEKQVKRALKLIRKANTAVHPMDLEKGKVSSSTKLKTRTLPYSEFAPYELKHLSDLKASAKEHYSLEVEKRHLIDTSDNVGKPRRIFPDLVEEVFKEQTLRLELEEEKRRSKSMGHTQQQQNSNTRPMSAFSNNKGGNKARDATINLKFKRPSTANVLSRRTSSNDDKNENDNNNNYDNNDNNYNNNNNDLIYSPDPKSQLRSADDSNVFLLSPLSFKSQFINTANNESRPYLSPPKRPSSPGTSSMRASIIEADEKLSKVKLLKKTIEETRRQELIDKIEERDTRAQRGMELFLKSNNQRSLLKIVAACSRVFLMISMIDDDRRNKYERKHMSRQKKAVWIIENWWWKKRLDLQVQRHPKKQTLIVCVLRMMCSYKVKLRNRSANLIKQFIKDQSGLAEYMKKVYAFRGKTIRIQKIMRNWLVCRLARLEVLNVALEKTIDRKIEAAKKDAVRKERAALMAAGRMGGFAETLVHINGRIDKLNEVFASEDKIMTNANRQEHLYQQSLSKIREKKSSSAAKNKIRSGSPDSRDSASVRLASRVLGKVQDDIKSSKNRKSWIEVMNSTRANRERLELLKNILSRLRKDHLMNLKILKHQRENRPREMVVNIDGLKAFLLNPFDNEAIDQTIDVVDLQERASRKTIPPFLMLTRVGGLQKLDEVATQLVSS